MNKKTVMTEQIMEQARTWYVRMGSELAGADDWVLFTDWLEESPLHVDAYDQVELSLSAITAPALAQDSVAQEHADNVVPLFTKPNNSPENKSTDQRVADKKRPKIVWARYAGIAALFVAALTVFYSSNFS
ncbi:MAG: FecR/PupR family sigma factor regulator, partial [Robiginitomaculum sp.]|nr:FecR/PupR family sigma factor regulator [Robiginitomaculum sp.]